MADPNWKALLVEPLLRYVHDVRRETGCRPTIEVHVHSEVYERLVADTGVTGNDDRAKGREGVSFGGLDDLTIRPERARLGHGDPGGTVADFIARNRAAGQDALGVANDPEAVADVEIAKLRAALKEALEVAHHAGLVEARLEADRARNRSPIPGAFFVADYDTTKRIEQQEALLVKLNARLAELRKLIEL